MSIGSSLGIALRALSRNKLQTALTTIGMTIGVATVLTMIALGAGAEGNHRQHRRDADRHADRRQRGLQLVA